MSASLIQPLGKPSQHRSSVHQSTHSPDATTGFASHNCGESGRDSSRPPTFAGRWTWRKPAGGARGLRRWFLLWAAAITVVTGESGWARSWRPNQIPNGSRFGCATCHLSAGGGGTRNSFGNAVFTELVRLYGNASSSGPFWSAALATIDSDGDSFTNGQELGDPDGTWQPGDPNPAGPVSRPGDANSRPPAPPVITTHPVSQTVSEGANVTFSVVATGATPLTYRWQKDGVAVGGNSATLTLNAVTLAQAGNYLVVVSNSAGFATSDTATLTVNPVAVVPSITQHPQSQTVTEGADVTLSVVATGTPPLSYHWKKDGAAVGGNSDTLTLNAVTLAQAGNYFVVVSNSAGFATSDTATLTVNALNQPPSVAVTAPAAGASLTGPVGVIITATAADTDGSVTNVQFFDGATALGAVAAPPFNFRANLGVGNHELTAKATDDRGAVSSSSPVSVTVVEAQAITITSIRAVSGGVELAWAGGSGPFVVQQANDLRQPWCSVLPISTGRSALLPATGPSGFFRVTDLSVIGPVSFSVSLNGAAERPNPVVTEGSGTGTLRLEGNTLTLDITYTNLSGPAIGAHLHGPADTTQSAGVLVDFAPFSGGGFGANGRLEGSVVLTPEEKTSLLSGLTYVNIHTDAHQSGEIRGQVVPDLSALVPCGSP